MNERELCRDLSRLIRGQLKSNDLKRIAKRNGFESFAGLCESVLPEKVTSVRLTTHDMISRLDRFQTGEINLHELWFWADELYNVSFNHRISYEPGQAELIEASLSVLSVICNRSLFPAPRLLDKVVRYVRLCLEQKKPLELRNVFRHAFEDLPVAHLAVKAHDLDIDDPGEDVYSFTDVDTSALDAVDEGGAGDPMSPESQWAEVVLLDGPFDAENDDLGTQYNWVIAFTVMTARLYDDEITDEAQLAADEAAQAGQAGQPAEAKAPAPPPEDRIAELRALVPNFNFDRYKARFHHDEDGLAEVILDHETIGPAEVRYAVKLFAMANRIDEVQLEGRRVKTLCVREPHTTRQPHGAPPRDPEPRA
ncbi:MAG: hypothetical protein ACYS22_11045 [Planctomycetota bacterium]